MIDVYKVEFISGLSHDDIVNFIEACGCNVLSNNERAYYVRSDQNGIAELRKWWCVTSVKRAL